MPLDEYKILQVEKLLLAGVGKNEIMWKIWKKKYPIDKYIRRARKRIKLGISVGCDYELLNKLIEMVNIKRKNYFEIMENAENNDQKLYVLKKIDQIDNYIECLIDLEKNVNEDSFNLLDA